ncbi:GlsB/YeaQ/YmgE family stress response membrane protein [Hyphomicrobium methylovorum]|uniref:GlsB/YeaQ/YmgE family stress response membrane protein n=1 Tax=Hyphomicrobium methylovorum TaxID=84 RepID=UPI0015E771A6|nr:GlsB/YeaQ/YmgE family stress response membrane protein [Hyphomicrobium methylovorum]MBA2127786.1 GlsB/YeaQ/YmgE family stress response membrane protein [Hyphomicrobium methylovorum]
MDDQARDLLIFAIIGIVAGFLASFVVGGSGIVRYLITGIIGAFVGGYLFKAMGINLGIGNELLSQIVTAAIGAIIVVLLARLIA